MIYYKNLSNTVKTFHGVVFAPQAIEGVSGYINDSKMVRVEKPEPKVIEKPKAEEKKPEKSTAKVEVKSDKDTKQKVKEQPKTEQIKSTPKEDK